jgi:hypothetical protein
MNKAKQKRRLGKSLKRRVKMQEQHRLNTNWRNIFVKAGILNELDR